MRQRPMVSDWLRSFGLSGANVEPANRDTLKPIFFLNVGFFVGLAVPIPHFLGLKAAGGTFECVDG